MGQAAVRAVLVVMLDVAAKDTNKQLATHDQQLVKALPADLPELALEAGGRSRLTSALAAPAGPSGPGGRAGPERRRRPRPDGTGNPLVGFT